MEVTLNVEKIPILKEFEDYPSLSVAVAGNRKFDVYMGIDIFGRGSYGGGQWITNVTLDVIKKDDVSAAMFAPGWIYETQQPPDSDGLE
ncbi:putative mannosyl-glycoprotein endo-beta-N-acetylglucosaminidase [Helianthus annuus]|nr:putative mannosyl-glycoprotein endo-beta-N-acetylglucosaminidase [Helianthus annuus]KAJ0727235.1 putative mannosyl-glycoprotein endo-beta-N-acetylglucosaminidase [Helianthus annuus]